MKRASRIESRRRLTILEALEPRQMMSVTPAILTLDGASHANGSSFNVAAGTAVHFRAVDTIHYDTGTGYNVATGATNFNGETVDNVRFSWNFGDSSILTNPDYVDGVRKAFPALVGFNVAHVYDTPSTGSGYPLTLTASSPDDVGAAPSITIYVKVLSGPLNPASPANQLGPSTADVESEPTYGGTTYNRIIFVDSTNGNSSNNGFAPTNGSSGSHIGPVASFANAMSIINSSGSANYWQVRFARGEKFPVNPGDLPSSVQGGTNILIGAYGSQTTTASRPELDVNSTSVGSIFQLQSTSANWTIQDINFGSNVATGSTGYGTILTPEGTDIAIRDCGFVGDFNDGIYAGSTSLQGLLIQDVNQNAHFTNGYTVGLVSGYTNDVVMVGNDFNGQSHSQPFIRLQPAPFAPGNSSSGVYTSGGRFLIADNIIYPQAANGASLTFKGFSYFVYETGNTFGGLPSSFGDDLENEISQSGNNPGFENSALAPWTVAKGTAAVATNSSSNMVHSGNHDAALTPASPGGSEIDLTMNVFPNTTYIFSAYVRGTASGDAGLVGVRNYSSGAGNMSSSVSNTSWTSGSVTFTTGPTDTSVKLYLSDAATSGGTSHNVYFDDTNLTQSTYNDIYCVVDGNKSVDVQMAYRSDDFRITYRNNIVERYTNAGGPAFGDANSLSIASTGQGTEYLSVINNTVFTTYGTHSQSNGLLDLRGGTAQHVSVVGNLIVAPNLSQTDFDQPLYLNSISELDQDSDNIFETVSGTSGIVYDTTATSGQGGPNLTIGNWNTLRRTINSGQSTAAFDDKEVTVTVDGDTLPTSTTINAYAWLGVTSGNAGTNTSAGATYPGAQLDFYGNARPSSGWTAGAIQTYSSQPNSLVLTGSSTGDAIYFRQDPTLPALDIWFNTPAGPATDTTDASNPSEIVSFNASSNGSASTLTTNLKGLVFNGTNTIEALTFDSAGYNASAYLSVGLTLNAGAGTDTLTLISTAAGGSVAVTSPSLNIGSGVVTVPAGPQTGLRVLTLPYLNVSSGTEIVFATPATHTNRTVLVIQSGLNLAGSTSGWTSTVDLGGNDLDLQTGTLAILQSQMQQGYNAGSWLASGGIVSSAAASDTTHLTALGMIQNNQSGTALYNATNLFDSISGVTTGIVPGAGDLLIKYTYYGDANLDGQVDGTDYSRIDAGSLNHLTGWFNGDFNYDGVVNGDDYTLIDNAFNMQGGRL